MVEINDPENGNSHVPNELVFQNLPLQLMARTAKASNYRNTYGQQNLAEASPSQCRRTRMPSLTEEGKRILNK